MAKGAVKVDTRAIMAKMAALRTAGEKSAAVAVEAMATGAGSSSSALTKSASNLERVPYAPVAATAAVCSAAGAECE